MRYLLLTIILLLCGCGFEDSNSEICFIGDSITDLWDVNHYFPEYRINKHAVSGAILEDVAKWKTSNCEGIPTVMLIGTNNISRHYKNDSLYQIFLDNYFFKYKTQVQNFKSSKFYAISVLPRNHLKKEPVLVNLQIEKFNERMHATLDSLKIDFKFIDIYDDFLDDERKIHIDYYSDGLHLSQEGYELMSSRVKSAL